MLGACSKKCGRPWDEFNTWSRSQRFEALNNVTAVYERCKEARGGTVNCREIAGINLKSEEEVMHFAGSSKFETCCLVLGKVSKIIVETLLERGATKTFLPAK